MLKYFFVFVMTTVLFSFSFAQQGGQQGFGGPPPFVKDLNLTQEQMEKMKAIGQANESEMAVLSSRMNVLQNELGTQMKDPNASEAALNSKVNELASALQKLIKKGVEMKFKMKAILTQEQWKKMHESGMFPPMMGGGQMGGPPMQMGSPMGGGSQQIQQHQMMPEGRQQQMPPAQQMQQGQQMPQMPPMEQMPPQPSQDKK
ncbi:MAG: Spy/CpxP family protein refolding chaperone [Elusimicrobia bacterium]|nr:Spy/CpxP family protein refolding chaperone [Elusimicrobiota bacterium]